MLTANPQIIVRTSEGDKHYELHEGQFLFAGRTSECDICLATPAVSRRHAILVMRNGKCGLKDLGSGNGTYLNGKRLERPVKLRHGDVIQIASHTLEFVAPSTEDALNNAASTLLIPPGELVRRIQTEKPVEKPAIAPAAAPISEKQPEPTPPPAPVEAAAEQPVAPEEKPTDTELEKDPSTPTSLRPHVDESTVARVRESIRLTPRAPKAPKVESAPTEDETDDNESDSDSGLWDVIQYEPSPADPEISPLADSEAAADFLPEAQLASDLVDIKEALKADGEEEKDADTEARTDAATDDQPPPAMAADEGTAIESLAPIPPEEANPNALPLSTDFRQAIETRLFFYSFMEDLRAEREAILAAHPEVAEAVKSEVDRQNREMAKPPNADQATDRIQKVQAKREALREKIKTAKKEGTAMPPRPSKVMREVEDIGINQWTIIAQSLREALPRIYEAGYDLVKTEPLGVVLEQENIDAKTLFGGSAYCLALEELLAETKFNRAVVREKLAELPPPQEKKSGSGNLLSKFARKRAVDEESEEEAEPEGENYESLTEDDRQLGLRTSWINQELAFMEELLIKEFWRVYLDVAQRFIPNHQTMPFGVRAFLRYGVIGASPWWMNDGIRDMVTQDCTNDIRHQFDIGSKITNVVYADEYLAAVMEWRCTPAMDENLEINEKNSPNWKADKALRRLINARAQIARTNELVDTLQGRIDKLENESTVLDERIKALLPGSLNFKQVKQQLAQEKQAFRIEVSKLTKLAQKMRDSLSGDLAETVVEVEGRFESGELPKPTTEFMIEREVGQVRRIGRLTANLKERLLPLAMREYQINTDAANDRLSILGELADVERRDPRIFLETLVPSKKKANRVDMRISPVVVLLPSAGILAFSWNPRQKPEDGRLAIPTFFTRQRIRERQITYLLSDFRWDTAKAAAGMDLMNSETIVAEFMRVRWDWRKRSREMREKGLIYTEQNDRTNWRRVYEAYLSTAYDGGKKLYNRNYDFYEKIVGKYFDLPENVELLRK